MPRLEDRTTPLTLSLYCVLTILTAILNSLTYKKMLNAYKSQDPINFPHNYEFFVNEVNVAMYFAIALGIIYYKKHFTGLQGRHWWSKQKFYFVQFLNMGFLDSFAGFLSCIGGAFVGGAVQSLINQTIIPLTLILSIIFLKASYGFKQNLGAGIIVMGAVVSVLPSFLEPKEASSARTATTATGIIVFLASVVPGAFSNVYKEYAFKTSEHSVDIYYMTTWVTLFQVLTGLLFMPAQSIPALGGVPFNEMGQQMIDGSRCMVGENPMPGDECEGAGGILLVYVGVNFFYNVFSLLVVKHGSASLSVIAAAVALPLTNMSFSWKQVMGVDYEPFDYRNLISTAIVLLGFIIYSRGGSDEGEELWSPRTRKIEEKKPKGKTLGLMAAGGSVMYMRPRADSDPTTPGYTPIMVAKFGNGSGYSKNVGGYGAVGETVPLVINGGGGGGIEEVFEPSSV
ncbi:hypothetical protein TrLO_g4870 [Triparma laevis f. longispina]|uniref:Uncharacterized protein n=1 Tax=Triparma laevis f. longispina TaxID=1714387 RepID=A0A9W7A7G7_9STRA|nr:hypothetical protein TrLO_g4870 [Triparma laevis f. longispina]